MSDAHTTTSPLPRAEQALRVLNRSLRSAELLAEYHAGGKFKASIDLVADMIKLAISLVETIPTDKRVDIKTLASTAATLAQRFGKFTPFKQKTVCLMIIQLIALWAEEK